MRQFQIQIFVLLKYSEGSAPRPPPFQNPAYATGFSILQTAKNHSFECIIMQNENHLIAGEMALSRWKSFIGTTKFKQRKRRVFMYILVVKPAVIWSLKEF